MEQSVVRAIGMCQVAMCVSCMGGEYGAVSCVGDRNVLDGSGA